MRPIVDVIALGMIHQLTTIKESIDFYHSKGEKPELPLS